MKLIKDIIIILFVTFFILFVLDIGVRVYLYIKTGDIRFLKFQSKMLAEREFPAPDMKKYGGYFKYVPGTYKARATLESQSEIVEYEINSKGFRNKEFEEKKSPAIKRVFCLGGSSTMGPNSPYEETYPYYLEEILNEKYGGKCEVINAGFMGYTTSDIYNLFKDELVNYEPDVITVYSAFNDSCFNANLIFKKTNLALRLHEFLYYRWMLYTVLLEKYSLIKHKNPIPFFIYESHSPIKNYIRNLENIIELARKNGIEVILVAQPSNVDVVVDFENESVADLKARIKASADITEIRAYLQYIMVKEMMRVAKKYNLKLVNPLNEFEADTKKYFIDAIHLTARGNRRLAEEIANDI